MNAVLPDPKPSDRKPLLSKDVKHFEPVAAGKFYEVTYQLGPNRSFGKSFGTNKWMNDTNVPVGDPPKRSPVYSVFSKIVDSENANGLISHSNIWRVKNIRGFNPNDPMGALQHMLAVIEVKELKDYVPETVSTMSGTFSYELFQAMIAREVALFQSAARPATSGNKPVTA